MLAALPEPHHRQLLSFHASSKANGGDKKWTLDEDAEILLQLKLGAMLVSERKLHVDGRSSDACRNRWKKYLKKEVFELAQRSKPNADGALHDENMPACSDAHELRRRFDSTGVELRAPVRDALVALHVNSAQLQQQPKPWQIEEDTCVLHHFVQERQSMHVQHDPVRAAVPVPNRSASAIRGRTLRLRTQLPPLIAAFPASVTNPEGATSGVGQAQVTGRDRVKTTRPAPACKAHTNLRR